jgi:hypothetical protein
MCKKFFWSFAFLLVVVAPHAAHAEIRINEVAWMGTSNSQYEEWIELYNDGSSQSLDGWKIYKAGGSTTLITLSGTISAGQYFLVCRTTPSVSSPLGGACDVNGTFGGSGLNNTSEHILLKDSGGSTIDDIDATSGWPAGDASTKETMQKSSSGWITAAGTPGTLNGTGDGNGGNNNGNNNGGGNNNGNPTTTDDGIASDETAGVSVQPSNVYSTMLLKVDAPKTAIVGSPVHFRAQALDFDRSDIFKGHYTWNMGDGNVKEFALGFRQTNDGFDYTYAYPGTYSVDVKYFHSYLNGVPAELEQKFTVDVLAATLSISKIYPDGSLELKNTSGTSIDVSNWQVRDMTGKTFTFAPDTFIPAGKSTVFPASVTKLMPFSGIQIFTPSGALVVSSLASTTHATSYSSTKKISMKTPTPEGEVLGVENSATTTPVVSTEKKSHGGNTLVYIMGCIILVLVAVIAVLLLRTETHDDGYELIEEE